MLWAAYKFWKPLAEDVALEKSEIIVSLNLSKDAVIEDFRENLDCKEGAELRGYLKL
jgi:hypothetical protein